jgi:hypothetical protein
VVGYSHNLAIAPPGHTWMLRPHHHHNPTADDEQEQPRGHVRRDELIQPLLEELPPRLGDGHRVHGEFRTNRGGLGGGHLRSRCADAIGQSRDLPARLFNPGVLEQHRALRQRDAHGRVAHGESVVCRQHLPGHAPANAGHGDRARHPVVERRGVRSGPGGHG